jgi:Domain of unknown function (DUF4342)
MTEEEKFVEGPQTAEQPKAEKKVVTEEIKVQVQDLFKAINDLVREGTARRVKVFQKDRLLVDIPLWAGIGSGVLMAVYMAPIAALISVGALLGGCTLRVEREEPSSKA